MTVNTILSQQALDQQNRALEAATVTLRYSTALCSLMGKTREVFDLQFLAKPRFFRANYCDVTKIEVPDCVLTCNMRNEFVTVRVYQAVKNPATTDEFAADLASCRNKTVPRIRGCCLQNSLIFIRFAKNISREIVCLHNHHRHFVYYAN